MNSKLVICEGCKSDKVQLFDFNEVRVAQCVNCLRIIEGYRRKNPNNAVSQALKKGEKQNNAVSRDALSAHESGYTIAEIAVANNLSESRIRQIIKHAEIRRNLEKQRIEGNDAS